MAALLAALLVAPFAAVRAQEQPLPAAPPEVDATIRAATSQKNHEMLDSAAAAYENLGKYDVAQTLLESALAIRGEVSGRTERGLRGWSGEPGRPVRQTAAASRCGIVLCQGGGIGRSAGGGAGPGVPGIGRSHEEDDGQAFALYQRAVNVAPGGPQAGVALRRMARLRQMQPGNEGEAESLYQRALALAAPNSADEATTLDLYAQFLRTQNRAAEAEPLESRSKQIRQVRIAVLTRRTAQPSVVHKVGGGITAPSVLTKRDPEYSEEARAEKFQGTVLLNVEIGPDGLAHNIRVQRGLGLGLDEKAMEAVQQWIFKPGTQGGQPVTVAATIEINFRLL